MIKNCNVAPEDQEELEEPPISKLLTKHLDAIDELPYDDIDD